jgi:hypothetical protein
MLIQHSMLLRVNMLQASTLVLTNVDNVIV